MLQSYQNIMQTQQKSKSFFEFQEIPSIFQLRTFKFQDKVKKIIPTSFSVIEKQSIIIEISDYQNKFYIQNKSKEGNSEVKEIGQSLITFGFLMDIIRNNKHSEVKSDNVIQILTQAIKKINNEEEKSSPDLFVKDIYGPDSSSINMPGDLLASSLGKLGKCQNEAQLKQFSFNSIARSLLISLAVNLGHLSSIYLSVYKQIGCIKLQSILKLTKQCLMVISILIKAYCPACKICFNFKAIEQNN